MKIETINFFVLTTFFIVVITGVLEYHFAKVPHKLDDRPRLSRGHPMLPKNTAIAAFLLDKSRDHISERTEIGLGLSVRFSDQEALQIFRSCNKAKRGLAITTGVISNLDVAWCDGDQFVLHSINGKVYVSIDDSRQPTILMFILPKGIDHAVAALRTIS